MEVGVLGPLLVRDGGVEVPIPGVKERTLLAHLVARIGTVVGTDELVDSLWPDDPPRTAGKTLQAYVARLRALVQREGEAPLILTEGRGYRLALDPQAVDAVRFAYLAELGRSACADGRQVEAVRTFDEALALWRGTAYGEFERTVFGRAEGRRLESLALTVREDRAEAAIELGDAASVLHGLEAHVVEHPLREHAWALLVRAQAAVGDQAAALASIDRAREVLADELGVDPGEELRTLHARVLAQDPSLRVTIPSVPPELRLPVGTFVGRSGELAALEGEWSRAAGGAGRRVSVTGPDGSGRWRTVSVLAGTVAAAGGHVVVNGSPAPGAPVLRVIDARSVPLTALPTPSPQELQVVVGAAPDVDVEVELGPLSHDDVVELLRSYAPDGTSAEEIADAAVDVLARSGGLAARAHDLSLGWARALVARRVAVRAGAAQTVADRLEGDRSALADDVQRWAELRRLAEADQDVCPWRGLASYEEADAPVYSGRERLTAELLARVALDRAVVLVGASGSGKSSLLRAGLLAALAGGALPGSAGWVRVVMRPGSHPMRELVHASLAGAGDTGPDRVADLLSRSLEGRGSTERLLLVVDQLEECWTTCTDAGERSAFLSTLADLATRPDARVTLVLAVRADHAGELATHAELAEALAGRSVLVAPPVERELRRVVEEPALRAGLQLDAGLADALVEDTLCEPGGLPLLSTALAELWEVRDGNRLTLASYVTSGGVGGAVARMAEGVYRSFDPERQAACRVLLRRLAGPGEGDAVVRRRTPLAELAALPDPLVVACVEPLAAARLLTVDDGYVEVAHEALFRSWPRLRDWLAEDSSTRDLQRRLTAAAMEWDAEQRDDTLLWKGARLAAATDLALLHGDSLTSVEHEFVEASSARLEAEKEAAVEQARTATKQNRRLRLLVGGTAAGLVVALVAGALAVTSRNAAVEQETTATAQRLAATAVTEDYLAQRMLTAVEAVRTQESPQTRAALLSVVQGSSQALARVESPHRYLSIDSAPGADVAYAAENAENIVRIDLATGDSSVLWSDPKANSGDVHVSPDGRYVAFMHTWWDRSEDSVIEVLDAETGKSLKTITHQPPMLFASFEWTSEPGRLAIATQDALWIEDVVGPGARREIPWPAYPGMWHAGLELVGDDRMLVYRAGPEPARLVDLGTGEVTDLPEVGWVGVVAPDGSFVVTQPEPDKGGPVLAVPLAGSGTTRTVTSSRQLFNGVLSADASILYLAQEEGPILVLEMESGRVLDSMSGHNGKVMGLVLSSDGRTLWSAGRDGDAIAWDVSGERRLEQVTPLAAMTAYAQRTADGALAALWNQEGSEGSITVVDQRTGDPLWGPLPAEYSPETREIVWGFVFTPDGSRLVVAESRLAPGESPDDPFADLATRVTLRDARTGTVQKSVDVPSFVRGLALVDGGRGVLVNGEDGPLLIDLGPMSITARAALPPSEVGPDSPAQVELSPDGRLAALGRDDGVVVVDVATLATVSSWPREVFDKVIAMAWVSDDKLATGGVAGSVELRSVPDGALIGSARVASPGFVWDIAVTAGGTEMATLGTDGEVLLWDTASMTPVGDPLEPYGKGGLGWLDWRGDRLDVLSDAPTPTMATYDLSVSQLMARACAVAGREPTAAEWQSMHGDVPQRPTCGDLLQTDLLAS